MTVRAVHGGVFAAAVLGIWFSVAHEPALARQAATPGLAPSSTLQEIASLLERRDLTSAAAAAAAALRIHPEDPALHNLAGVIQAQRGSFADAEWHLERAIALAPQAVAAYENLGRLYQERSAVDAGAPSKALDAYRRLLIVAPEHTEALFQAALLLARDGRFAESIAMLERLPPALRARPQVQAVMALARAGTGDLSGASAAAAALADHPDLAPEDVLAVAPAFDHLPDLAPALQMLEAVDRRGRATPATLHRLGSLYIRADRPADALLVLERAAGGEPSVPLLVDLARAASKSQQYERALGYLAHARGLAPDNADVHFLFGITCVQLDLVAEAHTSLKKAVELAPESAAANYAMGAVATHRRDPSESIPYFEKYVQLMPADPRGRFALGVARYYSNDLEGARRELLDVADRPETAAGANYFLARIARQWNDLEAARRAIDRALQAAPGTPDALAELGMLQIRAGEFSDAEASLRKALSIAPGHYQATVNLTALYSRTRDPRLEQQRAALAALQQKREQYAQQLLRMIDVVPR